MISAKESRINRKKRHLRVRRNVTGTATKPRLCVFRSLRYVYAQIVDDIEGNTLVAASSLEADIKANPKPKMEEAKLVGKLIGERAVEKGIVQVVFDRGGYKYHGRIKTLADAAREVGLKF